MRGPGHLTAPALAPTAPMHPRAWKVNSGKLGCSILDRSTPDVVVADKDAEHCMISGETPCKREPDNEQISAEPTPAVARLCARERARAAPVLRAPRRGRCRSWPSRTA